MENKVYVYVYVCVLKKVWKVYWFSILRRMQPESWIIKETKHNRCTYLKKHVIHIFQDRFYNFLFSLKRRKYSKYFKYSEN